MEIVLLTIGKTSSSYLSTGIEDYLKRANKYVPLSIVCLPDIKNVAKMSMEQQKEKEGRLILDYLRNSGDFMVLLDERGKEYRSVEFADFLQKKMNNGAVKRLIFVVGGPYGFSKEVYDSAKSMVSLSKMTLTHEMIRLLFTEQIYRAMTILRGEKYHHE